MIKNEADMVEAFVRHNIAYLDVMVILENGSTDGSREILLALQREGLPLVIYDDPILGYFQSEKMSHFYRKTVIEYNPDYVLFLDADEFINVKSRTVLESGLSLITKGKIGRIYGKTYIPSPDDIEENTTDFLRQIEYRRIQDPHYKAVIAAHMTDFSLTLCQGNHIVLDSKHELLPSVVIPDIFLGHFPIRSIEQFISKIVVGWLAYLESNISKPDTDYAYHWKNLYERIIRGKGITKEDLTYEALCYTNPTNVEDPKSTWPPASVINDPILPNYDKLKYGYLGNTSAISNIVQTVEQIFKQELTLRQARPPLNLNAIKKIEDAKVKKSEEDCSFLEEG